MGQVWLIANWKMYLGVDESIALARAISCDSRISEATSSNILVGIAPSYPALREINSLLKNSPVMLGAQDVCWEDTGAFTGAVSPSHLLECGVTFVIVGHSERRHIFLESNDLVTKKVVSSLAHGLVTILCVGETLEQRNLGKTEGILEEQLYMPLSRVMAEEGVSESVKERLLIAYEPVWAIGTGRAAGSEDIFKAHSFIKGFLSSLSSNLSDIPILYGGSVKPNNVRKIVEIEGVSGALIGSASVDKDTFLAIIEACR